MKWLWLMLVFVGLAAREARGCGLHWSKPVNHFDGVCEEGYVSHWEDWGRVDFGEGLKLPLIVGFRSDRNTDSPYLGRGWIVALLESHAYALDERKLRVVMPDGYHYTFRKQKNGVWDGNRGWLGEFKGNTFTAWAPCGWKIQWRDGKIQTIWTDKGRRIDYAYNGAMCTGVSESGRERVKVERNTKTGEVVGLVFTEDEKTGSEERIAITLGKKPEVEVVAGQSLVRTFSRSLAKAAWPRGSVKAYVFEVADTGIPTLKLAGDGGATSVFAWAPESRRIVSDGHWVYKTAKKGNGSSAAISRRNNETEEYWHYDAVEGREIIQNGDVARVRTWFVHGPARGKTRTIERVQNGLRIPLLIAQYDSIGRATRIESPRSVIEFGRTGDDEDLTIKMTRANTLTMHDAWKKVLNLIRMKEK